MEITREVGTAIRINDDIEVIVLKQSSGQVKFGIVAPKEVSVHRKEVYERIKKEHQGKEAQQATRLNPATPATERNYNV